MILSPYIADKKFYKKLLALLLPLVLQQSITSVVTLLDNVMVGHLSTESLSAVAIVNQLMLVFNLSLFGAMAGASIFGAQFHGRGSAEGVRYSFRYRLIIGMVITLAGLSIFLLWGDPLIRLYLNQDAEGAGNLELAFSEAQAYLKMCLWSMLPFAFSSALSSALRDTGETMTPMVSSVLALITNAILNYILIFGHLGLPAMGVTGAALATVISRFVEIVYLLIRSLRSMDRHVFLRGAFRSLYMPWDVAKRILITGLPLMINETVWSSCMAVISQCYSTRGLDAVAATNICGTVQQLFTIVMMSMGASIAIMVGQQLGAGDKEGARLTSKRLMFVNLLCHLLIGAAMIALSGVVPRFYNVETHVRQVTTELLVILGALLPVESVINASYFVIRSGGKTLLTFLFDCGFSVGISMTLALVLSRCTSLSIQWIYGIVQGVGLLKAAIGLIIVRSGIWLNTVIHDL